MQTTHSVGSKVLVHEADPTALVQLKQFCSDNKLIGLRDQHDSILKVLKSNIDLGAVFLAEDADNDGKNGVDLGIRIHRMRPELPIFLRRRLKSSLDDLPQTKRQVFAGAYHIGEINRLKELVDSYLFDTHYPNEVVRGIEELTLDALRSAFRGVNISCDRPYVVRDKYIYGELFSLMPIEAGWCRGYMMFQTEEKNMRTVIKGRKTQLNAPRPNFRDVNNLLSEVANMAWGGFKTRFYRADAGAETAYRVQVPIIINHKRKFISFGSDQPQLCLRYVLTDKDDRLEPVVIYQKLVFSLTWSPEKYEASQENVEEMVSTGELELF